MNIGKFNISKITPAGEVHLQHLDDQGNPLTTGNVVLSIPSLPEQEDFEGEPELTEDGLSYGESTMTLEQLEEALNDAYAFEVTNPIPPPVPQEIGPAQLQITMRRAGIVVGAVDAIIAGIADPEDKADAETFWAKATVIKRNHPLVLSFGSALGLSKDQIDQLFRAASLI